MIAGTLPREKLITLAQQLPASARVLAQLGELLMDVNSGLDDIARLLKRDTALAGRVLRISNSAAFGSPGCVASIEDAVSRVGFAEVYRLTGFASVAQVFDHDLPSYGISGAQLRANTLIVALIMEQLAKWNGVDFRAAYTAGLMRSTGKLVLERRAKQIAAAGMDPARSGYGDVLAWEESTFGYTSPDVAAIVLEGWNFPMSVWIPVQQHFLLQPAVGPHARITMLLHLSCFAAQEAGYALPGETNCWQASPDLLTQLNLTADEVTEARNQAVQAYEVIKSSFE